jgi:hypothetical protein
MIDLCNKTFAIKTALTPQKIGETWGIENPFEVVSDVPHIMDVKNQNVNFDLYKRAFHVLSEAKRVYDFKAACEDMFMDEEMKI